MARHVLDGHGGDVGRPLVLGELPYRAISHQGDVVTLISAHEVVGYRFTPGVDCIPTRKLLWYLLGATCALVLLWTGRASAHGYTYDTQARGHITRASTTMKESSYQTPRNRKPPDRPLVVGETTWA
jgi:hypothetical protein